MGGINFTITGADTLRAKLAAAGPAGMTAFVAAIVAEQERVITDAKAITPVDTGALRGSGTVLPPEVHGTTVTVQSGFGGAASEYAVIVHENLSAHHPVGEAKFLEKAFMARAANMGKTLGAAITTALSRLR